MNISIIGTGYVGLVSGGCISEFGFNVVCADIDNEKIHKLLAGKIPIYEPGLEEIVKKNIISGRLKFTTDIKMAVEMADVIFICVGTPPNEDGSADLNHVLSAARDIAKYMNGYKAVVDKSTVPVGTGQKVKSIIEEELRKRKVEFEFDVVSNPEFLREGAAINDFLHPDRIIIGAESQKAFDLMREVYRVLFLNNHPFVFTNIETAEIIKYASNAFLATKITFINEMANLCEQVGANVQHVAKAMGLDKRIGKLFLHAGPGYGGSCFPKDTRALKHIGDTNQVDLKIVDAVIKANQSQKLRMVDKIIGKLGDVTNRNIAVLGLSFKAETDDIREAPAITIIQELYRRNANIKVYDPQAMENSKYYAFADIKIQYGENEYDTVIGADAIVIVTEWNQFRSLDLQKIKNSMNDNYFFDLRNIYDKSKVEEMGFIYEGIGIK